MACKTESKKIGEHEYSVTQWPVEKSMLMKFKLIKSFGTALASLIATDNSDEATALSNAMSSLFNTSSPEELVSLVKSCVIGVACDGSKITESSFTHLFSADDMMDVYSIFVFVLKVNYSNLFKGQLADRFLAKATSHL
jgi:hypothetical protein